MRTLSIRIQISEYTYKEEIGYILSAVNTEFDNPLVQIVILKDGEVCLLYNSSKTPCLYSVSLPASNTLPSLHLRFANSTPSKQPDVV